MSALESFHDLFDLFHKTSFTDPQRIEKELAVSLEEWRGLALPLGKGSGNDAILVESVQLLVRDLQRDARRILDTHLERYQVYSDKIYRMTDDAPEAAIEEFRRLRGRVMSVFVDRFQLVWGLEQDDLAGIERVLVALEQGERLFVSPKELLQEILAIINAARQRKYGRAKEGRPLAHLDDLLALKNPLQVYIDKGFAVHAKQNILSCRSS